MLSPPPRWGPAVPSVPRVPAAWPRPGNPGAQPGGVPRRPLPPSGSTEPACDPAPKAVASIQCCQMTPAREDVLPQPRKESRQSPPRPCSGLSFKLPSAPGRSAASAPAARAPRGSQPPPRAPQTPQSPARQSRDGGDPAQSPHAGPLTHKNHLFARRREQRKSLTSALVQQLKLGLGMRRGHWRLAP